MNEASDDRRLAHLPSLDGLRALAVILTSLIHLEKGTFSGGFLGVDIFFVLSGFLITSLLLNTHSRFGRIDLVAFYVRRIRRLVPAVVFLLLVFTVVVLLASPTRRDILVAFVVDAAVMTYSFNWSSAFGHAPPWQVDHLWSLSVEEQFYFLWPLLLIALLKFTRRRTVMIVTAVAAGASMLGQSVVYDTTRSVFWGYSASPFHAYGILLGCLLAQIYVWRRAEGTMGRLADSTAVPALCLAVLLALTVVLDLDHAPTYDGGMLLGVIAAGGLVASMVARDTLGRTTGALSRLFSSRVAVAIGKRSYSIYLWQNFIAWALTARLAGTVWWIPANVVVTLACAEVSYRFVERRFMKSPRRPDRYAPQAQAEAVSPSPAPHSALAELRSSASDGGEPEAQMGRA